MKNKKTKKQKRKTRKKEKKGKKGGKKKKKKERKKRKKRKKEGKKGKQEKQKKRKKKRQKKQQKKEAKQRQKQMQKKGKKKKRSSHFLLKIRLASADCEVFGSLFFPLVRRRSMSRRGWSALETPASWYQVIRGPRPKPEEWSRAHQNSSWWRSAQWQWPPVSEERQSKQSLPRPLQVPRRWHRGQSGGTRQNPDDVVANAQSRAERLQSALDALGESESAVAKGLVAALQQAQRAAQAKPLAAQFEECQAFIKRSQNRLSRLEEERVAEQEALDAGLARLAWIRQEMTSATKSAIPVTIPNEAEDPAVVINQLRARVAEMEAECEGLRKKRTKSLSVPSPDMPGVDQSMSVWEAGARSLVRSHADAHRPGKFSCPEVESFQPVVKTLHSRTVKWCKSVGARYGHRGVRVGEATNPGPPKPLHRILASVSRSTNRFEILFSEDDLEVFSTVPASSGAVRAVQEARESQPPRGQRISQVAKSVRSSRRRRTRRLRALPWFWDSDTESADERNVARRVESQGTVVESVDDEQPFGRDSTHGPGVVQGGPELFAMSDRERTPQDVLDLLETKGPPRLLSTVVGGKRLKLVPQSLKSTPRSVHDVMSEVEEEAVVPGAFRTHNDESHESEFVTESIPRIESRRRLSLIWRPRSRPR